MHIDRRLVGWGITFILIGAVPLAVNAGMLDADLVSRWLELWPLLIIAAGVGLILARTPAAWVGTIAVALVVGSMVGGLFATGLHGFPWAGGCGGGEAKPFAAQTGTFGTSGRINVEFNCGDLAITDLAGTGSTWQLSGEDGDGVVPTVITAADGVTIKAPQGTSVFSRRGNVRWELAVPRGPTLDLGVTLNAGEGMANLTAATIASFNATVNAGSLTAALGDAPGASAVNVTVNAGSASVTSGATTGSFNLSVNAGSLDVCLAQAKSLRVLWHGTLASHDLDALGLVKVDNQTWTTPGFDAAGPHVELDVNANAGSFGLKLGGGCGA